MTDKDRLTTLLDDFGVMWEEYPRTEKEFTPGEFWENAVVIPADTNPDNPKNVGYVGFHTRVEFDTNGKIIEWGCWE